MLHKILSLQNTVLLQSEKLRVVLCLSLFLEPMMQFLDLAAFCQLIFKITSNSSAVLSPCDVLVCLKEMQRALGLSRMNSLETNDLNCLFDRSYSDFFFSNAAYFYSSKDRSWNRKCVANSREKNKRILDQYSAQKIMVCRNGDELHGFMSCYDLEYFEVIVDDFPTLETALSIFKIIIDDHQCLSEQYSFILNGLDQSDFDREILEEFLDLTDADVRTVIFITDLDSEEFTRLIKEKNGVFLEENNETATADS